MLYLLGSWTHCSHPHSLFLHYKYSIAFYSILSNCVIDAIKREFYLLLSGTKQEQMPHHRTKQGKRW